MIQAPARHRLFAVTSALLLIGAVACNTQPANPRVITEEQPTNLLAGVATIGDQIDSNDNGSAEAFLTTATATGASTELRVYLDASSTAARVAAGVYSDASSSPGTLLASATLGAPQAGAWNSFTFPSINLETGKRYWIALMAPAGSAGTLKFRDLTSGAATYGSRETNLTALPNTWTNGTRWNNSPVSAYLVGASAPGGNPPAPPPPPAPPTPPPADPGGRNPVQNATLDTHQVYVDDSGKLISWVAPQDKAFDRVATMSFNLLLNAMPKEAGQPKEVTFYHSEYDPDTLVGSGWPNNPGSKNAMLAESAALYYAYSGNRAAIDLVTRLLDHHLDFGTTPSAYAWPGVPFSTGRAGSANYGTDDIVEGVDVLEPDKIGELGYHGYLRIWQITGNTRYRDAAIACANVLASKIRPGNANQSPWPFRVNARTGAVIEQYTAHVIAPIRLFDELIRLNLGNVNAYRTARQQAWDWLEAYPLTNNRWTQYFEDVPVQGDPFSNLNQYAPGQTMRYLLEHPEADPQWRTKVATLLNWVESNFGNQDAGEDGLQYGARVISEQNVYKFKMGSHTSRFGAVNALYAAATGDAAAKDRAYRSLNWATYMARNNGAVNEGPAEFRNNRPFWFSDGHGDYIRHFMIAMGAFPEWAPKTENHLVKSTSILTQIAYANDSIRYETFDASSTETLRLVSTPTAVTADGSSLAQRSDLNAQGWVFDAASGVLRIRHDNATGIVVTLTGTVPPTQPPAPDPTPTAPALGNNATGTLSDYITDSSGAYINANRFQARASSSVTKLNAQIGAISGKYQAAIYADQNSNPGALLSATPEVTPASTGWNVLPLKTPVSLTNGASYWIAIWSNDPAARVYASGGGDLRWGQYAYSATWPASLNLGGTSNFTYSIYAQ